MRVRCSMLALATLVAAATVLPLSADQAPVVDFTAVPGSERWTAASGSGALFKDMAPNTGPTQAVSYLRFYEQSDEAIFIDGVSLNVSTDAHFTMSAGSVRLREGGASGEKLEIPKGFITAIQVCTNKDASPKLKGVRIWGATVDKNGRFNPVAESPKFERPNCSRWAPKVSCGTDKVAVEARGYYNSTSVGFSGMALKCAKFERWVH
jgi:hypothetical protein